MYDFINETDSDQLGYSESRKREKRRPKNRVAYRLCIEFHKEANRDFDKGLVYDGSDYKAVVEFLKKHTEDEAKDLWDWFKGTSKYEKWPRPRVAFSSDSINTWKI